jgi:2-keto-4-pentenoate hydratase
MPLKIVRISVLAAVCVLGTPPRAADQPDAQYVAELLFAAQQARTRFPDVLRINPNLDEPFLYDVQKRFITARLRDGARVGGYKGGFIPKAPIAGVLFANGIVRGSPTIEREDFQSLLVEAEIAFRFCGRLSAELDNVAALKSAVCEIYPAIELPDAALPALDRLLKDFLHLRGLLIATNMASSHLLLGEGIDPADIDLDALDIRVEFDGTEIGFRDGIKSEDRIWHRVLWIVNEYVLPNGYDITPEHVIIPGALTGIHPGKPGSYDIDYGALGRIEFRIR